MKRRAPVITAVAMVAAVLAPAASAETPDEVREPRLDVTVTSAAGTTVAWASLGTGPTLVLLNGTASPMNEWDPELLGALSRDRRVIVLDYPGLGLSGPASSRWTFPRAADWIEEFLDAIVGGERVDVLGWSMGGFIAQRLALQHPSRVRSLVLAATNPGGDAAELGPAWVQETDSTGGEQAYLITNYPAGQRAAGQRFLDRLTTAVDSGAYPVERVPARTRNAMVAAEDPWLRSNANMRELSSITNRTLVITGAADVITPPANSRLIAARIAGSELRLMARSGHSFLFQRPSRTAAIIDRFLDDAPIS